LYGSKDGRDHPQGEKNWRSAANRTYMRAIHSEERRHVETGP
jgi:hypothetical protein